MPATAASRRRLLGATAVCLTVLVALAVMVQTRWGPLTDLDRGLGRWPETWTSQHVAATHFWLAVQLLFSTLPMAGYTVVVAVLLLARGHRRASVWVVTVMVGSSVTVDVLKHVFARARPVFTDPVETLSSFSFPSGHAGGVAAGMGVAVVLTILFVRARGLRRVLLGVWVAVAVLVGADRVFLGVHNVSDVVAGWCVGAIWVLVTTAVLDPAPRMPTRAETLPSALPGTRKLAVVLNPVKVEDPQGFQTMVDAMAARAGWDPPTWYATTIEDPGRSMAEDAAIAGAELVIVCGGDGTVRTVCAELAGTGIPVGVVPTGTGNLLARNLEIPLYLQAAVDVALSGQDRAIDLVAVAGDGLGEDEHFMVMAGMGFDAAIMEGANDQIKARVGWLAYVVSAMRNLMFPAVRLEISLDEGPFTRHRARTVVVGNVGYLQAGIPLLPDATIDDGEVDVVLLAPRRFLSWVPLAFRVLSRRRRTDAALDRMTGRRVVVRASHDTPRQLDGDPIGMGRELRIECIHGKLLVRVPR